MVTIIVIVLLATGCLLAANVWIGRRNYQLLTNSYLNFQIQYQPILLAVATGTCLATALFFPSTLAPFFSIGKPNAPAKPLPLFGIQAGDGWVYTGFSLCIVISLVTGIFMYLQIRSLNLKWTDLVKQLAWILLFAASNAFGEEVIYRLCVVAPLYTQLTPFALFLLSAVLFGWPHYWGMPNGVIGVFLAGVLGFVLAKSVVETQGIFWASLIHWLQDIIIIGSMVWAKSTSLETTP
jgi:membrane protease YdiL (CAAX protease family)